MPQVPMKKPRRLCRQGFLLGHRKLPGDSLGLLS
jgi:hypothetical protein